MPDPHWQCPPPYTKSSDTGNQEDPSRSMDDLRCQTAHSMCLRVLPGTSPSGKRQVMQVTPLVTDTHVTSAAILVSANEAGHPGAEVTEVIVTANL